MATIAGSNVGWRRGLTGRKGRAAVDAANGASLERVPKVEGRNVRRVERDGGEEGDQFQDAEWDSTKRVLERPHERKYGCGDAGVSRSVDRMGELD